jgi:hypothetical protein
MPPKLSSTKSLQTFIIDQAKKFLIGLESGVSDDILSSILLDIRQKELELIQKEGTMLDPEIWRLLRNRLANRRNKDIIDTGA